jgi:NAD(P)-dependent dehydrogenase (short-subunit alcohol dehydrogenase family)
MLDRGRGTFLQIGTSSGVRTREGFAALGAAQHALRALVQVAAREWRASGVHVAYVPVDGPIASERTRAGGSGPDRLITPEGIAEACAYLHAQKPDAWTHELLLRPTGGDWSAPT